MAKIPSLGGTTRVQTQGPRKPTRSIQSAGIVGNAQAGLGQAVQNFGNELIKKRRIAEVSNFGDTNARRFQIDTKQKETELRMQFGGDHAGYADAMNSFMKDRLEEIEGSGDAGQISYFNDRVRGFVTSEQVSSNNYETTKRSEFFLTDRRKVTNETATMLNQNPDPVLAAGALVEDRNNIEANTGLLYTPEGAVGEIKAAGIKYRDSVVDGVIQGGLQGLTNIDDTDEEMATKVDFFLDGGIEGSKELFSDMPPEEKRRHRNNMLAAAARKRSGSLRAIKLAVKNAAEIQASGEKPSPQLKNQIDSTWNSIRNMKGLDGQLLRNQMVTSKKVGSMINLVNKIPPSQLDPKMVDTFLKDNNLMTSGQSRDAKVMIENAITDSFKRRQDDPVKFIEDTFGVLDTDASVKMQKDLGVFNTKVFSKDVALSESYAMIESKDPRVQALKLDQFTVENGKHTQAGLVQMAEVNSDFGKFMSQVSYFDSLPTKERLISNSVQREGIEKTFEAKRPGTSSAVKTAVAEEMASYSKAFINGNNQDLNASMQASIELEAKRLLNVDSDLSVSDAVEKANETTLGRNFDVFDEDKANFMIPKGLGVNKKVVDNFLDGSLSTEALKGYGIDKQRYTGSFVGGTEEEFFDSIAKRGHWAATEDQRGMYLMATDPRGLVGHIEDKNGNHVRVDFDNMSSDQRTLDNMNSIVPFKVRNFFNTSIQEITTGVRN